MGSRVSLHSALLRQRSRRRIERIKKSLQHVEDEQPNTTGEETKTIICRLVPGLSSAASAITGVAAPTMPEAAGHMHYPAKYRPRRRLFRAEPPGQGQSQDQRRGLPKGSSIGRRGRELPMIEVAKILLMRTNIVGASEPMVLSEIIYIIINQAGRNAFRKRKSKKTWTIGQGSKGDPRKNNWAHQGAGSRWYRY